MADYKPTVGLEIHAELKTKTKMFCDSRNNPNEKQPNINICPICTAQPGTLPTINKEAVRHVLRVGVALGGTLADFSEFDRKNYFYPDIPKGYQISQYKYPLVSGGSLRDVAITRVHLEEDTARSSHGGEESLVDFNRAGIPLMELVTEPVIHSAGQAGAFARELQLLLRTLGASDANLEKGEMRIEANISVSKSDDFGTKVEVKNLNSFRSVERAIEYEVARQIKVLESGGAIVQETHGWDENKGVTFRQRVKEGAADYRYFPEPDLPKLQLSEVPEFSLEALRADLPELPWEKRKRYRELGLKEEDVEYFVSSVRRGSFFDAAIKLLKPEQVQLAANYIGSDLAQYEREGMLFGKLTPESFATVMGMIGENKISSRGAKDILAVLVEDGGDPEAVASERGLFQVSDAAELKGVVATLLKENVSVVEEFRGGKESALQFLIGQGMKATKGSANPGVLKDIILAEITK